jgi:hypothetical protein
VTPINYEGRTFRSSAPETAGVRGEGPVGHFHQEGRQVWAEFAGGKVIRGRSVGTCGQDGTLELAYCQLLEGGAAVAGLCTSRPEHLGDGRIRLAEHWRRFDQAGSTGVSYIEEVPVPG